MSEIAERLPDVELEKMSKQKRNEKFVRFYNVTNLKAYHYVKEFGEGFDRICRELEANGANVPTFRAEDFILKITVPKVTVNDDKVTEKVTVNDDKVTVKVTVRWQKIHLR